jgi:tryptophanyl-tRNA synthetase
MTEQTITPWEASSNNSPINYTKLLTDFGCSPITTELLERFERLTKQKPHHFLTRGIFYSHRDLEKLLDLFENGKPFYLYTGRGPSSEALHLGHLIPFMLTKYLQHVFNAPLVIQLTDDEKFLWKNLSLEECHRLAIENTKDIIACGFDIKKTFIFSDLDYIHRLYPNILKIQKLISAHTAYSIFGFNTDTNIGKIAFPAVQSAPSFSSSFPIVLNNSKNLYCLIPQAIDQDPYFRLTRDVAKKLGYVKPALIHSKFFPSLQGNNSKMSASNPNSSIYVSDSEDIIKNKIKKYAVSGAPKTLAEHREKGANLEIDIPFQYLQFFLEDENELERIKVEYSSGRILTSEVKEILCNVLIKLVKDHQERRKLITDDIVREFMTERNIL